ncbi:hypothetical protein IPL68_06570 [Candidatus Saccharibacteria bacterium]|nr:MAG: hypothetical protein IPL68_06570 [Candidatus Saccharibacteria bacterium]
MSLVVFLIIASLVNGLNENKTKEFFIQKSKLVSLPSGCTETGQYFQGNSLDVQARLSKHYSCKNTKVKDVCDAILPKISREEFTIQPAECSEEFSFSKSGASDERYIVTVRIPTKDYTSTLDFKEAEIVYVIISRS